MLVVEDEAAARNALAALLADEGYDVEVSANGEHALEIYGAFLPDVVVTDLRMPGMDGTALLHALRRKDPLLPVIFLTAFSDAVDGRAALGHGAAAYLAKPVDLGALLQRLRQILAPTPLRAVV